MMGLELLQTDLMLLNDAFKSIRNLYPDVLSDIEGLPGQVIETVKLIDESTSVVVEICDDLLQYDKFERNSIPLCTKRYRAAALFNKILHPIHLQV